MLIAAVACGLLVTAFVEVLSVGRWLDGPRLALLWGVACIAAASFACWARRRLQRPASPRLDRAERLGVLGCSVIAVVTLITALAAPPNTFDVLVYHMSRVAHWAQNHSVDSYPTHILRQLHQPPGAEYAVLNIYLLTGGDRFVNLVAWSSAIGCMVATSSIAAAIGMSRRAQIVTALCAATLPMLQAQASGAKNDVVAAFWLSSYVALALRRHDERQPARSTFVEAGALALALLTKGTTYLFAPPLVVWMLARRFRQLGWRVWRPLATTTVVCLLVNAAFFVRNQEIHGAPLGPGREAAAAAYRYVNDELGVQTLGSNVLRNTALQLTMPSSKLTRSFERRVAVVHAWFGWRTDEPSSTWGGQSFSLQAWLPDEERFGSPVHAALLLLACLGWRGLRRANAGAAALLVAAVAAYLLFCALLKWQPWHARLHLPLLVVGVPVVAATWMRLWRPLAVVAVGLTCASSACTTIGLHNRSWLAPAADAGLFGARDRLYFVTGPEMMSARSAAFARLRREGVRDLGLIVSGNEREYVLWTLPDADGMRIEHVAVDNASAFLRERVPFQAFVPQALLVIPCQGEEITIEGRRYPLAARYDDLAVHLLERRPAAATGSTGR